LEDWSSRPALPTALRVLVGLAMVMAALALFVYAGAQEEPPGSQDGEAAVVISSPANGSVVYVNRSVMFTSELINSSTFGEPVDFLWDFGDGSSSDQVNPWHAYSEERNYTVTLTINDAYGNFTTASITVEVRYEPLPSFSITIEPMNPPSGGAGSLSAGQKLQFNAQPLLTGGTTAGLTYLWDFGDGTVLEGDAPAHSYSRPGTYNVTVTVSDGRSSSVSTQQVIVKPVPPIAAQGIPGIYLWFGLSLALVVGLAFFFGGTETGLLLLAPIFVFLYSKIQRDELLDNYTRGQIHGYIMANPGEHYNGIRNALDLNNGTLAYHLRRLELEALIKSRLDGMYRRYYPAGMKLPEPNGQALTEVQTTVLAKIRETPGISQSDIASLMKLSNPTVNYHMERLLKKGLIRRERSGMRYRCFLTEAGMAAEPPHEAPKPDENT